MTSTPRRSWGRTMLSEFAAKQQMLSVQHVFTDVLQQADGAALEDLLLAIDAVLRDAAGPLRAVLVEDDEAADAAFCRAVEPLTDAQAGMALALAYLPVEAVDTAATLMLRSMGLTAVARAIDPRDSLTPRTRLFIADRMIREPTLQGLLAAVSALAALRANSRHRGWRELAEPSLQGRLERLRETVLALRAPAVFAGALSACLRGDWPSAERRLRGPTDGMDHPPRLADLFAVSLLPTCDAIEAVQRLRGMRIRSDVAKARFATPASG